MPTVNVYLNFNGNCEEAFNFYKTAFGSDFAYLGRFKDMPAQEGVPPLSPEQGELIMHVSLPISNETTLMGSDTGGEWANSFKQGNNFSISINADSKENAEQLFASLSAEGQTTMPLGDTFWGDYFGMFTDKFGINWMISYNQNQQTP
ncbi:VOC family protein [Desertivirga arenae]|uniref:VOC family protein n=1 Tax=Desertivirga arenae TaxID=2810309 RepID=UPI001A97AC09|nr:VOC family protein [Pedobacter sp. SYSU D00823]